MLAQFKFLAGDAVGAPRSRGPERGDRLEEGRIAWRGVARYAPGSSVQPFEGSSSAAVLSGWGCEARVSPTGRRQIVSILLPGDAVFLPARPPADAFAVTALTRLEMTASFSADASPAAAALRLTNALTQQSQRLCDHIVRLGALSAHERTVDFLLELHLRLSAIRLVKDDSFKVPLTQEVFSEILGLSVVHMNRTLSGLKRQGLITMRAGSVTLHDLRRLTEQGRGVDAAAHFRL